jgi:NTE family protein
MVEHLTPARLYARGPNDGPALLGYQGLADLLDEVIGDREFSDLKIPFSCTAVDLHTAHEVYLNTGRVRECALATMAIPGIFPAVPISGAALIDGGVLDPVPVRLARLLAPNLPVIAVALNPNRDEWDPLPQFNLTPPMPLPIPTQLLEGFARMRLGQALQIFVQSIDITARMLTELRLEMDRPEVIIRPAVHQYGMLDAIDPHILYQAGVESTRAALSNIRRELSWPSTIYRILRGPSRQKSDFYKENGSIQALLKNRKAQSKS